MDTVILEEIKKRLIATYQPDTIYLFGSHAWGTPDKNSDIDLAVIVKTSDEKSFIRSRKGTLALWDIEAPIDLLVYTQEEFKSRLEHRSNLQYKIAAKGIKIYEAA